jgi:RNA polymerase sigma factor (sigma-70 family)
LNQASTSGTHTQGAGREQQGEVLVKKEGEFQRLAAEHSKQEFFKQITPLLQSLKSYIKRQLRIAYLTLRIRTPVDTSGDILDEVVLEAYENYGSKPADLTLEQWLYQIANEKLERYVSKRKSLESRRKSLETLTKSELRTLEEMPITADAEGEPWLPEDLDDREYQPRDFIPPAEPDDPERQLERKEEFRQILRALCHVPEQERIIFELFAVEGLSKEAVAKILNISPDEVPRMVEKVRSQVLNEVKTGPTEETGARKKAS